MRSFDKFLERPRRVPRGGVGEYFDSASGRLFVVARPTVRPELWSAYIEGAWRSYRQHGVERAVDFEQVRDGASTALFFAAVELEGQVVGGLRVQGPYTEVEQPYALREWAGREGTQELRAQIASRLDQGVIEIKAVWVERGAARRTELTAALARAFVHSLKLMNVRYALCTAASHAVARWQSSGGVVSAEVAPVPYPDGRYQTRLMWWDRQKVIQLMSVEQALMMLSEFDQLPKQPMVMPAAAPSVA